MIELTGKQVRTLRSLGQTLKVLSVIGKAGLTEGITSGINHLLDAHELVKIRVPAGSKAQRQEAGEQVATACGAGFVGLVGRTVLLYRPCESLPNEKRITFP